MVSSSRFSYDIFDPSGEKVAVLKKQKPVLGEWSVESEDGKVLIGPDLCFNIVVNRLKSKYPNFKLDIRW